MSSVIPVSELCEHVHLPLLDPEVYCDNLRVRETHKFYSGQLFIERSLTLWLMHKSIFILFYNTDELHIYVV
jgi:hypothetical protein